MNIEILPANTCPKTRAELSATSAELARFAAGVHLDVSDGVFAPVVSWPYGDGQRQELEEMRNLPVAPSIYYEAHLMVQDPVEMGVLFTKAGARRVIGHFELFGTADAALSGLEAWIAAGAKEVGLAFKIDTPLAPAFEALEHCDVALLMSIDSLGSQGATFDQRIFTRIQELHARFPELSIAVDGGVNETNIAELVRAGARAFRVGSAIDAAEDPAAAYNSLVELAQEALVSAVQ